MISNKLKITNYYPESKGKPIKNYDFFLNSLSKFLKTPNVFLNKAKVDKSELLKNMGIMGDREIPLFISNACGTWINPYYAFNMFGKTGFPIEMMIDQVSKHIGEDAGKYWYEWCDFWLDTFLKGDMNKIKKNYILN